jgi:predicted  nucleic acid-binding Zn-ribbon protein
MLDLNPLLRELHRLRKLIRDAQAEIERAPKVLKAHQTRLANQEKALADAKDALKHRKADVLTGEASIKSLNQSLAKHEKQLDTLTDPRQVEAKQHDIANTKELIAKTEDDVLTAMADVDERTAKIPELEAAVTKAKADFAAYEKDSAERVVRLKDEVKTATAALAAEEAKVPPAIRGQYDRLVKAHGADAFAAVENQTCTHCRVGITQQGLADLRAGSQFICCRNCGRAHYMA